MTRWLDIHRGDAPLLVAFPHSGTDVPARLAAQFVSPWLARKDGDWWIDQLYGFAHGLGATTVRTSLSRSVIDVNRDPSGASLYPGQATTELCPTTTFDGEPLYRANVPGAREVARRRAAYFDPYHAALAAELARLGAAHSKVVLYDAHSIRSTIPRLFAGELPQFNIGTNAGTTCDADLTAAIATICAASGRGHVVDGRFTGGWTTRHYGDPAAGRHAIQMELAMRGYLREPGRVSPETWPPAFDAAQAAPLTAILTTILQACLAFARA